MKILYWGGCWATNVGEAFIDIGALRMLKRAMPEAEITIASDMSSYYAKQSKQEKQIKQEKQTLLKKILRPQNNNIIQDNHVVKDNFISFAALMNPDVIVASGMFATEEFIDEVDWKNDFLPLMDKGAKVVFIGLGGRFYNHDEINAWTTAMQHPNIIGFISRDEGAYSAYSNISEAYRGIDCAFFVPEEYKPSISIDEEYTVCTFDAIPRPIEVKPKTKLVINAHHMVYNYVNNGREDNIFISDVPYDYFNLYANALEVHTDLVHATIISLGYGTKVKFYHKTLRSKTFAAVGAVLDNDGFLVVDPKVLEEKKEEMVHNARKLLQKTMA